jgi:hypothetical protein
MNDFERILDDCVERLTKGTSTLEECLSSHPQYADQLRPLLCRAAGLIDHRGDVSISPSAAARGRAKLTLHMKAHPRQRGRGLYLFQRLALGIAVMMFALLSVGTVRAQSALPSDLFYAWKLASERVWRRIAFDTNHVDLVLADRRVREIVATADDPTRRATVLRDYQDILLRLEAASDADEGELLSTLETHQKSLKDAGLAVPELDDYLSPQEEGEKTLPELPQYPVEAAPVVEIPSLLP